MWRLLKAEIVYNRSVLIYILTLSVISFITVHYYTPIFRKPMTHPNAGIVSAGHMFFFFIGTILVSSWWKEHTYRSHLLLPLGVWKIGVLRVVMFLSYWFALLCIYFIWSRISQHFIFDNKMISVLCTQTGFILTAFSLIFFWSDLRNSMSRNKTFFNLPSRRVLGFGVLGAILFVSFISVAGTVHTYQGRNKNQLDQFLSWLYQSHAGPLILIVLGLCLTILTIWTFGHRRSYVG